MSIQQTFNKSIQSIFSNGLPRNVAIALSGGVDSMCLARLLNDYIKSNNLRTTIYPITINHNLRETSSLEIPIIRNEMAKLGLGNNYLTHSIQLGDNLTSFEEIARIERYKALTHLCQTHDIQHIFLAHHLDDQLETFILRLFANSGVLGLGGMKSITKSFVDIHPERLNLARPMLSINKADILSYCVDRNVEWVQDYTNFDEINKRNTVRKYLKDNQKVRSAVLENFNKCNDLSQRIEQRVKCLYDLMVDESRISQDNEKLLVKFKLDEMDSNWDLVLSRLLFKLAYPISPSKNYHYGFHKLYNKFPIIKKSTSFSLLQLQWDVVFGTERVEFTIKRQNLRVPVSQQITVKPNSTSEWCLFDNRFWLKFTNTSAHTQDYVIKTLSKDDKSQFDSIPKNYKYSNYSNLPVIIDNNSHKIISIPALNPTHNITCQLKENIYAF